MHIVVAADADFVINDVIAALGGPDVSFTICRSGREVSKVVDRRGVPDLCVLDLQIGSMGGMAVTMGLRLDESAGRYGRVPVLLLLDREADIHLAKRCDADQYLVKPVDPLRLKRAARRIIDPPAEPEPQTVEEVTTTAG